jgi:acyl carrier protein
LVERLRAMPSERRDRALLDLVRTEVRTVLGAADAPLPVGTGLLDLGFDSLTAVELRNRLGAVTGLRLLATLLFDYPTVGALATHLAGELAPAAPPEGALDAATDDELFALIDNELGTL